MIKVLQKRKMVNDTEIVICVKNVNMLMSYYKYDNVYEHFYLEMQMHAKVTVYRLHRLYLII